MATELTGTLPLPDIGLPGQQGFAQRFLRGVGQFIVRKPLGALGGFIVLAMILAALINFAGLTETITGYRYDHQVLSERFQGTSAKHLLGTDQVGRDIFSRVFYGSRVSITIGFAAVAISQGLAALIGITSGYYGGKVDFFVQRIVDLWQAMPGLVALIFLVSVFGTNQLVIICAIGFLGAAGQSRVLRGTVIGIKNNQYIEAARALGASDLRIITRHILPNVVHILIIGASIGIGGAILIESTLAFLGFGLPPPYPTWGRMINEARQQTTHPMIGLWPGLALTLTVFGFNVFGDALRDVWDPRMRGSR